MKGRPITPDEVKRTVPEEVIDVWNALIQDAWDGQQAIISQTKAVTVIALHMNLCGNPGAVARNGYLDIECIYRDAGWVVNYDKPGYNESYTPTFTFRKKK